MRKLLLLIPIVSLFLSCDKEVGFDGVVQDSETGQMIPGVTVKMKSEDQGSETDITGEDGYFNTFKHFSCGIASCNTNYSITFTKENYETLVIRENYYRNAEYLDPETRDTMIVKLVPNN